MSTPLRVVDLSGWSASEIDGYVEEIEASIVFDAWNQDGRFPVDPVLYQVKWGSCREISLPEPEPERKDWERPRDDLRAGRYGRD